jgi:hypothetical protein
MELNLLFAIAAPIAMIAGINWLLQRGEQERPLLVLPTDLARRQPIEEKHSIDLEAANDEQSELAA